MRKHFSAPAGFRIARCLLFDDMKLPGRGPSSHTPCSTFSSHICDDLVDRRDVLLQEIGSYLVLQNDRVNHQFEATQAQKRSIDQLKRNHFEEPTVKNPFVFLYLEKSVRPERGLSAHNKRSGGNQGYWHCRPKVIIDSIGRK